MKSVLISIQPKWCALIARGVKTIEVRKTAPKIATPFKCYIYETQGKTEEPCMDEDGHMIFRGRGMVIGEFVCDEIIVAPYGQYCNIPSAETHLDALDLMDYADGKTVYGWHISDLVIYDEPKELAEFWSSDKCPYASKDGCTYEYHCFRAGQTKRCGSTLERPPQSWCYVEEV